MNPDFVILDHRFRSLILGNGFVEKLWTGSLWAEGPVWFGDSGHLLWSDIPNDRMLRWSWDDGHVSVFRRPSGNTNGHTRDRLGRLVSCEHGNRRVSRTEYDGRITVLADRYQGKRLNSPNDVIVKSDGTVWFTDPSYGILSDYEGHKSPMEVDGCHVYRCDPEKGTLDIVANDFDQPNGIAFSPDESILYVTDTGGTYGPGALRHIRAFDVGGTGTVTNSRVLAVCDTGKFDGFRLDTDGNIWSSAGDGVHCFAPDGTLLGKILIPEVVSNLCFGGPKKNRLFITATTSLYSVYVNARGAQTP